MRDTVQALRMVEWWESECVVTGVVACCANGGIYHTTTVACTSYSLLHLVSGKLSSLRQKANMEIRTARLTGQGRGRQQFPRLLLVLLSWLCVLPPSLIARVLECGDWFRELQ